MSSSAERALVQSSLVASLAYSSNATLEVEFCRGTVYRYRDVPRTVFDELLRAESVGAYFNRHIRDRYRYQRLV